MVFVMILYIRLDFHFLFNISELILKTFILYIHAHDRFISELVPILEISQGGNQTAKSEGGKSFEFFWWS